MANRSAAASRLIDRRTVLQVVAAALAAAGPALTREGHAAARLPFYDRDVVRPLLAVGASA